MLIAKVIWKILREFADYDPQSVTLRTFWRWISQYPWTARMNLLRLLDSVIYYSKAKTEQALVRLNQGILDELQADGVGIENVIYVTTDSPASSSHVMLSVLRDAVNLESRHALMIDSSNVRKLLDTTTKLRRGAVIYVDDFVGTGKQFLRTRDQCSDFIGNFSEFLLAPVICEEGLERIASRGIKPVSDLIHRADARPLRAECELLSVQARTQLIDLSKQKFGKAGLGFGRMASMVVFYRDAPNNTPLILRGNLDQDPCAGIFPRADDLPAQVVQ